MKKFKNKNTGEEVKVYNENYYIAPDTACIPKRFIENSCDWEEVKEKSFEIISFSYEQFWGKGNYAILNNEGNYAILKGKSWSLKDLLKDRVCVESGQVKIHSVKRFSDGEIFTVGDKAKDGKYGTVDIIDRLSISNCGNSIYVATKGLNWGQHIEDIDKVVPLFKTEDGVDIFCGSTYYCVNTAPHLWSLFEQTAKQRTNLNKGVLAFSTKKLAEAYLLMYKPSINLHDVLVVLGGKTWLFEEFEKIVIRK